MNKINIMSLSKYLCESKNLSVLIDIQSYCIIKQYLKMPILFQI